MRENFWPKAGRDYRKSPSCHHPERVCESGLRWKLIVLHDLVNYDFAAFIHGDDLTNRGIAGHGDVDHVVAGIQREIDRRGLLEHVLVYGYLRAFGLSFYADRGHPLG